MPIDDFRYLTEMIRRAGFDSSKLTIAKRAAKENYMTAAQVRDIMTLFTFESNRLDFAKYSYESVIDQQRFYIVYDAFTFSSSIDHLERYLRG